MHKRPKIFGVNLHAKWFSLLLAADVAPKERLSG
jgi:hypothetical protein